MDRVADAVPAVAYRPPRATALWIRAWKLRLRVARALAVPIRAGGRGRLKLWGLAAAGLALLWLWDWRVIIAYLVIAVLWSAFSARRRVVVEDFEDHTVAADGTPGDDASSRSRAARGTAALLANRLAGMRQLYQVLEQPVDDPRPGRPTDATVQLEDVGDVLRSAFSAQTTLSVGPVTLPIGAVMALVGRLVQAPRLHGAVHGDAGRVVMTVELDEHGHGHVWCIEHDVTEAEASPARVRETMITELAYRIFADLSLRGQAEWPATESWLAALGERRACQRTAMDRRLHLRRAETHLWKALEQDQHFYLAAYNLGVVHRELARTASTTDRTRVLLRAAVKAFEHATSLDGSRWEAHYGCALARWDLAAGLATGAPDQRRLELDHVVTLCQRALELDPGRDAEAQICDLLALTYVERGRPQAAMEMRHRACGAALAELASAHMLRVRGVDADRLERLGKQAAQCVLNLATAYAVLTPRRDVAPSFGRLYALGRFAAWLSDLDADAHAGMAVVAQRAGRTDVARQELESACRLAPKDASYWARLSLRLAGDDVAAARAACDQAEHVVDFCSLDPHERAAANELVCAFRRLRERERASVTRERIWFARALADAAGRANPRASRSDLGVLLAEHSGPGEEWNAAHVLAAIGKLELRRARAGDARAAKAAEGHFGAAIDQLKSAGFGTDIRRLRLHAHRAAAIALQEGRAGQAIAPAESATTYDPLSAPNWAVLAEVHERGKNYGDAVAALEQALRLVPEDAALHLRLAKAQWWWASQLGRHVEREEARRDAVEHLHKALELYDSGETVAYRREAHWWAALCHRALGDFEEMPEHLSYVLASLEQPRASIDMLAFKPLVEVMFAIVYRFLHRYNEAETHAVAAVKAGAAARRAGCDPAQKADALMGSGFWPLAAIEAAAHLQLAGCHSDRRGDLGIAAQEIATARAVLAELPPDALERDDRDDIESDVAAEEGRRLLAEDAWEDAAERLSASTALDPREADVYVDLARAYEGWAAAGDPAEAARRLERAREACIRAREVAGPTHPHATAADSVLRGIEERMAGAPVPPPDAAFTSNGAGVVSAAHAH